MKTVLMVLFLFLTSAMSFGNEALFSFFSAHKLGSKGTSPGEGFLELPEVEIFERRFSAYCMRGDDRTVKSVSLSLRDQVTGASAGEITRIFEMMKSAISNESGEAGEIQIPNFQDGTERTGPLFAWKNQNSILIIQKISSPGRTEIVIDYSTLDYFLSNLGADTGDYLRPRIEAEAGKLNLPFLTASTTEPEQDALISSAELLSPAVGYQ